MEVVLTTIVKSGIELLDEVMEQKIKTIIVTHKDRFIRFGYDWFEKFCMKFNTTIVVVNNEELSPQKNSYRILFQYFMCSPAGCMDFVSIKNK